MVVSLKNFLIDVVILFGVYFNFKYLTRKNNWKIFNSIFSTINALQCIYMVFKFINYKYYELLYTGDDYVIYSLYWFAAYLFVDGIFKISETYNNPDVKEITSLLHHFIGGLGIFMIAYNRNGLGLGLYFAGTELSTPFLNISWLCYSYKIKNRFIYVLFYVLFYITFILARILSIPILISYLIYNSDFINELSIAKYVMVYGGSSVLILLNLNWFIMLTKKLNNI